MCNCTDPDHVLTACLCACHGQRHTLILIRLRLHETKRERV